MRFSRGGADFKNSEINSLKEKRPDVAKHPGDNGDDKIDPCFLFLFNAPCPPTLDGTRKDP
ncbi:MAG: hypothetical protein Pars2KO_19850 [Parasphingorhabdus sp.]